MKIGFIVYSATGNTLSVAEKAKEALVCKGQDVTLERIEALPENERKKGSSPLKYAPDVSPYDVIIFASFVEAFSLCSIMKSYLKEISSLSNKKVYCFVTQAFSKPWLGGNKAIRQIIDFCSEKDCSATSVGIVNWKSKIREDQISDIVNKLENI